MSKIYKLAVCEIKFGDPAIVDIKLKFWIFLIENIATESFIIFSLVLNFIIRVDRISGVPD